MGHDYVELVSTHHFLLAKEGSNNSSSSATIIPVPSASFCKCELDSNKGISHKLNCSWKTDNLLELISIGLATVSIAWVTNRLGYAKDGIKEVQNNEVSSPQANDKNFVKVKNRRHDNCLKSRLKWLSWKHRENNYVIVQIIGVVNVVIGITVAIHHTLEFAITESALFFICIPFILFRAATPDALGRIKDRVKLSLLTNQKMLLQEEMVDDIHDSSDCLKSEKQISFGLEIGKRNRARFFREEGSVKLKEKIQIHQEKKISPIKPKSTSGKQHRTPILSTIWRTLRLCFAPHFLNILVVLNTAIHNIASIEENVLKASNSSKIEHNFAPSVVLSWSIDEKYWKEFSPQRKNKRIEMVLANDFQENTTTRQIDNQKNVIKMTKRSHEVHGKRMNICFKGWIDEKKWGRIMKQVYGENSYSQVNSE